MVIKLAVQVQVQIMERNVVGDQNVLVHMKKDVGVIQVTKLVRLWLDVTGVCAIKKVVGIILHLLHVKLKLQ